jgi:hypothetical protein
MFGTLADVRLESVSLVPWCYQAARALEEAKLLESELDLVERLGFRTLPPGGQL